MFEYSEHKHHPAVWNNTLQLIFLYLNITTPDILS